MTDKETAWLAGILEGEGCFSFNRTAIITLSMTDLDIVKRVAVLFGNRPLRSYAPRGNQKKSVHTTSVCADRAMRIMGLILPYMGERRSARIKEVMAICAARPGVAKGEKAGHAKLTDKQAGEIKSLFVKGSQKPGERSFDLAKKYGISQSALWYVINKRQTATLTKKA